MHTSQTTHHRIFFANVTKPDYLEGLCRDLGLEKISDSIYDLALHEGNQLSVEGACRIATEVAKLGNEHGDAEDLQFMLGCMARLLAERGYTPHSTTFDADVDLELLVDQDISCLELFDLLSALSYGYEVRGIYTQWAMTSNKAAFGANAGGTRITMRDFSVPCSVYPNDAEGLIHLLAQHRPENIGDIFIMKLILPLIEMPGILNKTMELAVQSALMRSFGGMPGRRIPLRKGTTQDNKPAPKKPTLEDFRQFTPNVMLGWPSNVQFYAFWMGYSLSDMNNGRCPVLPADLNERVTEIRDRLASGEDLDCPAIHQYEQRQLRKVDPLAGEYTMPVDQPNLAETLARMEGRDTFNPHSGTPFGGAVMDATRAIVEGRQQANMAENVIDRDTHKPIGRGLTHPVDTHVFMGVQMEQTGRDYSLDSISRHQVHHDTPAQSQSDNTSSSSNDSSPSSPSE
ncbi:hypothetical protein D3C76_237070 [compost metagenome]